VVMVVPAMTDGRGRGGDVEMRGGMVVAVVL